MKALEVDSNYLAPVLSDLSLRVDDINSRYVSALDQGRFDLWPQFFCENCVYKIVPRECAEQGLPGAILFFDNQAMMRDRVLCVREVSIYAPHTARHFLGRPRIIGQNDNIITARTNILVVHSDSEGRGKIFAVGEYQDILVIEGSLLRFREKIVLLDNDLIDSHLAEPL